MSENKDEERIVHKSLAMAKLHFQGEIKSLTKSSSVEFNGKKQYDYVDLAALMDYALPILTKHGLLLEQFTTQRDITNKRETKAADGTVTKDEHYVKTTIGIRSVLSHPETSSTQDNLLYDASDIKSIKEMGGLITYLRRYSALTILGLSAEDDDGGSGGKPKGDRTPTPDPEKKPAAKPADKKPAEPKKTDAEIKKEFEDLGLGDKGVQTALQAVGINTMAAAIKFRANYPSTEAMMAAIEGNQ